MANARAKTKTPARTSGQRRSSPKTAKPARPARPRAAAKPAKARVEKAAVAKAGKPSRDKAVKAERPAQAERAVDRIEIKAPVDNPEAFRLVVIERAEPPTGAAGRNWYRYTIRQGANAINGYLQGTAAGVKTAAEQIVGQLNERRAGRWGYRTTRAAAPAASA